MKIKKINKPKIFIVLVAVVLFAGELVTLYLPNLTETNIKSKIDYLEKSECKYSLENIFQVANPEYFSNQPDFKTIVKHVVDKNCVFACNSDERCWYLEMVVHTGITSVDFFKLYIPASRCIPVPSWENLYEWGICG